MLSLPELQRRFGEMLAARRGWEAGAALALDRSERVAPRERLLAYRSNVIGNLRGALASAYPIVAALVGEEYLEGLAREYAFAQPSTSGDLAEYGAAFAEFLASFAPARELPYLPDVARLEWAVHRAYGVADEPGFDPARLAVVPEAEWPRLRPVLSAAARVIRSAYPIRRIWSMHQLGAEAAGELDLGSGGEAMLVHRPARRVELAGVDAGEFAFLDACEMRASLEDAAAAASQVDAGFSLETALARFVGCRVVIDLRPGS